MCPVKDSYQHTDYPNVWAAGIAVNVPLPFTPGKVPYAFQKTGYPSDETGKIVAENIIRVTKGETKLKEKAWEKSQDYVSWMQEKKLSYYLLR